MNNLATLTALLFTLVACSIANASDSAPVDVQAVKIRLDLAPGTKCTSQIKFPELERFLQSDFARKDNYNPGPILRKREVAYSGKDTSCFSTYSDGDTKLEFIRNGFYLAKGVYSGLQIQQLGSDGAGGDFRGKHFPELAGMPKATYKGIVKIGSTEYYLYEAKHPETGCDQKVYFSIDTLYPHHMISSEQEVLYSYEGGVPIGQFFELPEDLAARWKNLKEQTKRYYGRDIDKEGK